MNQSLMAPYTEAEIIVALKGMGPTKASGCDGFSEFPTKNFGILSVLDGCIDDSQNAFVPGRLITYNLLLAYEICLLILSFDVLILFNTLFLINGKEGLSFKSTKGLRQGDPLSPYLFLFCREGLSVLMRLASRERKICGAKVCRASLSITHLMFVDGCILFGEVSNRGINTLKEILREYEGMQPAEDANRERKRVSICLGIVLLQKKHGRDNQSGFTPWVEGRRVEGDSWSVICKLQETKENRSAIAEFIEDSKKLSMGFKYCGFLFINMEANEVAHIIATEGIKKGENTYLLQMVPYGTAVVADAERRWTNYLTETKGRRVEEESEKGYKGN
ncbi:hypothetical protein PVK06_045197 [Gossypium arboreum]|uniref:RNase H type-1 domain-containing protein n=1 Tax=Gossypium arboreum TaxID=29729 RepID=A0ABR0MV79_GOSAR|nr:hypothetical protein PVK06_045197 [Gossypium arboreum]